MKVLLTSFALLLVRNSPANAAVFLGTKDISTFDCDEPPEVEHASVVKARLVAEKDNANVFKVKYACNAGYGYSLDVKFAGHSLDGKGAGHEKSIDCKKGDKFGQEEVPKCLPLECPIPDLENVAFASQKVVFSESVKVTCMEGWRANAQKWEVTAKCGADHKFDAMPSCEPTTCGKPPKIAHASYAKAYFADSRLSMKLPEETALLYKDSVKYTCEEGYATAGMKTDGSLTCGKDGRFEEQVPECKPVECGVPPKVEHASYDKKELIFKQSVEYTCEEGYTMSPKTGSKTAKLSCGADGSFGENLPKCKPVECGLPPDVHNSFFESKKLVAGQSVQYTCHQGYTLTGNALAVLAVKKTERLDSNDTNRAAVTRCAHKLCKGGTLQEHCLGLASLYAAGNTSHQAAHVTNLSDRTVSRVWAFFRHCAEKGQSQIVNEERTNLSVGILTCNDDGSFGPKVPQCLPVKCGAPPEVKNAQYDKRPLVFSESVLYSCMLGFTTTGKATGGLNETLTCKADGKYDSAMPACSPVSCGEPPFFENTEYDKKALLFKESVQYSCKEGFRFKSGNMRTMKCGSDGKFIGATPKCEPVTCDKIVLRGDPDATSSIDYSGKDKLAFMDKVEQKCKDGFSYSGKADGEVSRVLTCGVSGKWDKEPVSCKVIQCGAFPKLSFIRPRDDKPAVNDPVEVSCLEGSSISGKVGDTRKLKVTCEMDGRYHLNFEAGCQPIACGKPPVVDNAEFRNEAVVHGQSVDYKCAFGHTFTGLADGHYQKRLTCQIDGKFDEPPPPKCKPITCHVEEKTENGWFNKQRAKFGKTLTHFCDFGYSYNGMALDGTVKEVKMTVTCGADGRMTPEIPPCKLVHPELEWQR